MAVEASEEESVKSSEKVAYSGIKTSDHPSTTGVWTQKDIESEYRKFNLDLAPKVLTYVLYSSCLLHLIGF